MRIIHISNFDCLKRSGIGEVVISLSENQRLLGHEVFILQLHKSFCEIQQANMYFISNYRDYVHYIREIRPDIVIFHSVYKWEYILFSHFLKRQHIPYLIEPHGGSTYENLNKSYYKKKVANFLFFKRIAKNAAGIVYLNKEELQKSYFTNWNNTSLIIPNGINIPLCPVRRKTTKQVCFVFLGRIDINHKGIDILLDALKLLQEKVSKDLYSVKFYGYGEDKDIIELKHRLGDFEDNIKYMGPVWGEVKNNVFSSSDILLLTSRYEGMPMGILEALSFGCLCLITPQTNFGNIINENACGWVVSLKSLEIASVMQDIIYSDKEHWPKMIENAQKVAHLFAWDKIAKLSIEMYQKVL